MKEALIFDCRASYKNGKSEENQVQRIFRVRSGCGSVGRAVASDIRGPRFESSHRQKIINIEHLYTVNCVLKRRK